MLTEFDWIAMLWMFVLGGIFGSFMNVVVYRLPLGMSLVKPNSQCPACHNEIRWFHNVPVAGWLMLRGRCFDCGVKISPRYPAVEATVAVLFAAMTCGVVALEGSNLPDGSGWALCAYQLVMLCGLTCGALMHWDHRLVPVRMVVLLLAAGVVPPLLVEELRRVASGFGGTDGAERLITGLCGAVAGIVMRTVGWPTVFDVIDAEATREEDRRESQKKKKKKKRRHVIDPRILNRQVFLSVYFPMVSIGVVLGWQAVVAIGCFATAFQFAAALLGKKIAWLARVPLAWWQLVATVVFLMTWSQLAEWVPMMAGWG